MAWNQLSSNHSPGAHVATQWYQKTWVILAFLFFFFPVGVFLMWKFTDWKKRTKQIFSGIFGVWFIFCIFSIVSQPRVPAEKIKLGNGETIITIDLGEYKKLPIKYEPENATPEFLECRIGDPNIIYFSLKDEKIEGRSEGSTTIYVKSKNLSSNTIRVVVEDKERIEAEQEEQKQKNEKQANDIVKQIKALEEPTLDNKSKIEEIRKSYDKLPSEVKTLVTNLSDLETAEKKISELEQAQREQERLEAEAAEQAEQERLAAEQAAQQKAEQEKAQQQQQQETPPQQTQQEKPQQPTQQEKPVETPKPPEQQTQPPAPPVQNNGNVVWIATSGKGTKYHSSSQCGTMKDSYSTSKQQAESMGFSPCSKCY